MTYTGTCHFKDLRSANLYYKPYHFDDTSQVVNTKIHAGEIVVGTPPPVDRARGEAWFIDADGRYTVSRPEPAVFLKPKAKEKKAPAFDFPLIIDHAMAMA
jgi:hypothetical protein